MTAATQPTPHLSLNMKLVKSTCMAVATWPAPPQAEHVVALVPACTPLLLHFSHCSRRVTSMVFLHTCNSSHAGPAVHRWAQHRHHCCRGAKAMQHAPEVSCGSLTPCCMQQISQVMREPAHGLRKLC